MKQLLENLKRALKQGLLHIFSTTVINKILAMLTNIVIVRVLTKAEYGYFSHAYNIVMIVATFSSLGMTNAILQYGCESTDQKVWHRKEKTLFLLSLISNLICSVGTLIYALFVPLSMPEAKWILATLSFFPVAQFFFTYITMKLRVLERNKEYALVTNLQSVAYFIAACLGGWLFSLYGTTIGRYVGFLIPVLVGAYLMRKELKEVRLAKITKDCKEEVKYSLWVLLSNASTSVFSYFDVFVIGIVVADAVVLADYRVASQIPTALAAIPMAIATFIYPKFVRNQNNPQWVLRNYKRVQIGLGVLNFFIVIGAWALAPWIIRIMYGPDYASAVYPFRILMLSYFFAGTFRTITGHVLSMLHQIKPAFYLGVIGCLVNILADFLMIKAWGSIGAAYAMLFVVIFGSALNGGYFYWYMKRKAVRNNTPEKQ